MTNIIGSRIHITGIVQGVGFRPFVYALAIHHRLHGWVRNTSSGVDIEVDGSADHISQFTQDLQSRKPPLSTIDNITFEKIQPAGYKSFEIIDSKPNPGSYLPISPDICICEDCLAELIDPNNRRYHYPFINCTNCGPRFTIIENIPYDRHNTTMSDFTMCQDCESEYHDPLNRRFHAQPIACPVCGPKVWLEFNPNYPLVNDYHNQDELSTDQSIQLATRLLRSGKILALKGLGGFHLACDATNDDALTELRKRKFRIDKPYAVMMADLKTVEIHCYLDDAERQLLESRERPIVILRRRNESTISELVAPRQNTLGVMLPYTPLHYLLFIRPADSDHENGMTDFSSDVFVMTSGNVSEEPIVTDNDEARQRLTPLCDGFLMHDRPIHIRCDDSVTRVYPNVYPHTPDNSTKISNHRVMTIRRSRGYAPSPIRSSFDLIPILATGAELKNTICLARDKYAFISHHIGDTENYETLESFEKTIEHYQNLYRTVPQAISCDLHPDYLSTRYAISRAKSEGIPVYGVQHHHAHIASCMVENHIPPDRSVIGVAFDGTGYGPDGKIWGGEFLIANYENYQRFSHLQYMPLPGGDSAIRKPARIALAYLLEAGIDLDVELPTTSALCFDERMAIQSQIKKRINIPYTSSMGRLFDAVASFCGVKHKINYEAQAAIELEALIDTSELGSYSIENLYQEPDGDKSRIIGVFNLIRNIIDDVIYQVPTPKIAAKFHNTVINLVVDNSIAIRNLAGLNDVVLSGGVWQNNYLVSHTIQRLMQENFQVHTHHIVPPNDGGISLGQAVIASTYLSRL